MKYEYLVVGAGLFGAVFARELLDRGKGVLVVEKQDHIGGALYTREEEGIVVHCSGPHIFHTSDVETWNYVNKYQELVPFVNSPLAKNQGRTFHLPFSMYTFRDLWGITTPEEARAKIDSQRLILPTPPKNLEEQALSVVGREIYELLVRDYTEKQWGRPCAELPASLLRRVPLRFTWNKNYFDDPLQGVPRRGYTPLVERLLQGADVLLSTDFLAHRELAALAGRVLYTGPLDEYFGCKLGRLSYRTMRFHTERLEQEDFQGNAVVNFTGWEVPYIRAVEHKHFLGGQGGPTLVTYEYPGEYGPGTTPYYPVRDGRSSALCREYLKLARKEKHVNFGGRLGSYSYLNMDQTVKSARACAQRALAGEA